MKILSLNGLLNSMNGIIRILLSLLTGLWLLITLFVFSFGFCVMSPFIISCIIYEYVIEHINKNKDPLN
jgi:hypothetical protein